MDVSVEGAIPQPFALDTAATVSVLYDNTLGPYGLQSGGQTVFVRGIVAMGDRPMISQVNFKIGQASIDLPHVVVLERPDIRDDEVGLLGTDILSGRVILFDAKSQRASLVPTSNLPKDAFAGWKRIKVSGLKGDNVDSRLFFSTTLLKGAEVPVLIDTGSNINFINWQLAKLDDDILQLERDMKTDGELQGALETTMLTKATRFYDLEMGQQAWDRVDVVIMKLDTLSTVAPVHDPLMIAGASLFSSETVAFDLEGGRIYIRPEDED